MNCGLLCGLFMVKHHGLIIIDVAVWILTFEQDPIPEPINIIGVAVWCLFLNYPIIGGDYQEFLNWRAYFQFSGTICETVHRFYRKQIIIFREECGYCCALPCDLYKDYKDDHLS